jgi:hypothetical protein
MKVGRGSGSEPLNRIGPQTVHAHVNDVPERIRGVRGASDG